MGKEAKTRVAHTEMAATERRDGPPYHTQPCPHYLKLTPCLQSPGRRENFFSPFLSLPPSLPLSPRTSGAIAFGPRFKKAARVV